MKNLSSLNKILILVIILLPLQSHAGTTVINNSVSVTSNDGVSTTHIKTVHNGEVVEDTTISTSSPINYHSEYVDSSTETYINVDTQTENAELVDKLNSLIAELNKILAYYEKLLAK